MLISAILVVIGVGAALFAFFSYPEAHHKRFWENILLNNFYFTGIAIGGTFFIAIQYASNAGWSAGLKRIPEAFGAFLPIAALLMLFLFFGGGMDSLYHWAHDPLSVSKKAGYLNKPFFLVRIILIFGIWIFFWWLMRSSSIKEDNDANIKYYMNNRRNSAIFLVLFAITISFGSFDWMMSLESHWFSTMFGVYGFAGVFVQGVAVTILITVFLKQQGYLKHINENHLHDLGKFLFGFSTFWVYIWFFQFMLIWYANMPEETGYFLNRTVGYIKDPSGAMKYYSSSYTILFIINPIINWVIPFVVLMMRNAKRNVKILTSMAVLVLVGHWLDYYLMVFPSNSTYDLAPNPVKFGIAEIGITLGYAGLFILIFAFTLSRASLIPKNHPLLEESLHHHF